MHSENQMHNPLASTSDLSEYAPSNEGDDDMLTPRDKARSLEGTLLLALVAGVVLFFAGSYALTLYKTFESAAQRIEQATSGAR